MSDDITISGLNGNQPATGGNTTNPGASKAGSNVPASGIGNGSSNVATSGTAKAGAPAAVSPKNKTEQSPVIDLRQLEPQKNTPGGSHANPPVANSGSSNAATATTPAATTPATAAPSLPNLSLEETAMMEAQAGIGPGDKYAVPALVKEKFPDLVDLIKQTESMNDEERDYWFQILPIMTEDQIGKFRDILLNEKQQLAQLDKEYEQELNKLNEKHVVEWEEFKSKEKRAALTAKESKAEAEEKAEEEDLLKRLSQV